MIDYNFEETEELDINYDITNNWISSVINKNNKILGDITYIFCSDDYLLNINKQYLNHDYFTDIITFNYCERDVVSGDIFISIDTVRSNSETYEVSFLNELYRVIIHGILHLLGYNDKTDEEQDEMTRQENLSLEILNNSLNI